MKKIAVILSLVLVSISLWTKTNDETDYLLKLMEKKYASHGDGIKMLALVILPNKKKKSIQELGQIFVSKKILTKEDLANLDQNMTKGFLAKMIMKSLNLSGGVGYSIFGGGRYAFRECQYKGFFKSKRGNCHQYISGSNLISVIKTVEDYSQKQKK